MSEIDALIKAACPCAHASSVTAAEWSSVELSHSTCRSLWLLAQRCDLFSRSIQTPVGAAVADSHLESLGANVDVMATPTNSGTGAAAAAASTRAAGVTSSSRGDGLSATAAAASAAAAAVAFGVDSGINSRVGAEAAIEVSGSAVSAEAYSSGAAQPSAAVPAGAGGPPTAAADAAAAAAASAAPMAAASSVTVTGTALSAEGRKDGDAPPGSGAAASNGRFARPAAAVPRGVSRDVTAPVESTRKRVSVSLKDGMCLLLAATSVLMLTCDVGARRFGHRLETRVLLSLSLPQPIKRARAIPWAGQEAVCKDHSHH